MLEIKSLTTAYGENIVLKDINLDVKSGEILAVIGPNGAGKSTLIRAISGVIPLLSGTIRISGKDLSSLSPSERARLLAVVPQARQLPPTFTVYQTVLLGRTPYLSFLGQANKTDHARVNLALERARVIDMADRPVGHLSGGEGQRVLLARALAQDTPVMLLDEPTTHLDLQYQTGLLSLVNQLVSQNNLTVLMVLHDLNLAALYADRVALLVNGKVQALGTPTEVLTEATLGEVYNIPVRVIPHPDYGTPFVMPDGDHSRSGDQTK